MDDSILVKYLVMPEHEADDCQQENQNLLENAYTDDRGVNCNTENEVKINKDDRKNHEEIKRLQQILTNSDEITLLLLVKFKKVFENTYELKLKVVKKFYQMVLEIETNYEPNVFDYEQNDLIDDRDQIKNISGKFRVAVSNRLYHKKRSILQTPT